MPSAPRRMRTLAEGTGVVRFGVESESRVTVGSAPESPRRRCNTAVVLARSTVVPATLTGEASRAANRW